MEKCEASDLCLPQSLSELSNTQRGSADNRVEPESNAYFQWLCFRTYKFPDGWPKRSDYISAPAMLLIHNKTSADAKSPLKVGGEEPAGSYKPPRPPNFPIGNK